MAASRYLRYSSIIERLLSTSSCTTRGKEFSQSAGFKQTLQHDKQTELLKRLTFEAFDWLSRSFCSKILEYFFRSFLMAWSIQRHNKIECLDLVEEMDFFLKLRSHCAFQCYLYLLLGEERRRTRPPQQLAETVFVVFLQQSPLKRPQPVRIVNLHLY